MIPRGGSQADRFSISDGSLIRAVLVMNVCVARKKGGEGRGVVE